MESNLSKTYLHLGSNIGNRQKYLYDAKQLIINRIGSIILESKIYETQAWGVENQANFLNQACLVQTPHTAEKVLQEISKIEKQLGRTRQQKWHSRTIDVDILFYENHIINLPHLKIPHPLLHQRNFVLIPMLEIAPDLIHPTLQKDIGELYKACKDEQTVWKFSESQK